jgi:hypothetical protein
VSAPAFTLAQLLATQGLDEIRARYLAALQGAGFPALTEWVPKAGVEMSHVNQVVSFLADDLAADLPMMIATGFLGVAVDLNADAALDLFGQSVFQLTRNPPTSTSLNFALTCAQGAGPFTWAPGDVRIVSLETGNEYINSNGGTVAGGAGILLNFVAAAPGASYNDDPSTTTFALVTSFAGVTIAPAAPLFSAVAHSGTSSGRIVPSVPQALFFSGGTVSPGTYSLRIDTTGDLLTARCSLSVNGGAFASIGTLTAVKAIGFGIQLNAFNGAGSPSSFQAGDVFTFASPGGPGYVQGSDKETNLAYALRCRSRWRSLSLNPTAGLFTFWALRAVPQASRLKLSVDPIIPGRALMIAADSHGPLDPAGLAAIVAYVIARLTVIESFSAAPATKASITATGTVLVGPTVLAAVQDAAQIAWSEFLGNVPIGGTVKLFDLVGILQTAGATDSGAGIGQPLAFNGVTADLMMGPTDIPVAAAAIVDSLTWITTP